MYTDTTTEQVPHAQNLWQFLVAASETRQTPFDEYLV